MRKTMKNKLLVSLCLLGVVTTGAGYGALKMVSASTQDVIQGQTDTVSMIAGAACRIDTVETSGLRFLATVDIDEYQQLQTTYSAANVYAGMMIVPQDVYATLDAYTISELSTEVDFTQTQCFAETEGFRTVKINNEDTYVYSKTLVVKESNYSRNFVARSYIKIVGEEGIVALEDADYYNGAYYLYSDYSLADNMRSVYKVANAAYNDRLTEAERDTDAEKAEYDQQVGDVYSPYTEEQLGNLKKFVDGVLDVKTENGKAVIANNSAYYTSPYSIIETAKGSVIDLTSATAPLSMQFDGERVTDLTVTGEVPFAKIKKSGATISNGQISFNSNYATATDASGAQWAQYWNWFSFVGDYGVGTYVDFTFTGNQIPQLVFFAEETDPVATVKVGKGIFLTSGYGSNPTTFTSMQAFGPNRLSTGSYGKSGALFTLNNDYYPELTSVGLAANANKEYAYTVGTFTGTDGKVGMHIILKDVATGKVIYDVRKATGLTASEVGTGNILVLPAFEQTTAMKTIKSFSAPYAYTPSNVSYSAEPFVSSGATFNADGSVTLAGVGFFGGSSQKLWDANFGYIGFNGNYGVGTTLELEFTGLNIPDVILFAPAVNGYKSSYGGGGLLLTAGCGPCNSNGPSADVSIDGETSDFRVYAGRIAQNTSYDWGADGGYDGYTGNLNATLYGATGGSTYADYPLLTQAGLKGSTDTYKYVVTTKLNAENKVVVVISLYKKSGDAWVDIQNAKGATYTNLEIVTSYTEADITGTNIIVQSTGVTDSWQIACTFKYKAPYFAVAQEKKELF